MKQPQDQEKLQKSLKLKQAEVASLAQEREVLNKRISRLNNKIDQIKDELFNIEFENSSPVVPWELLLDAFGSNASYKKLTELLEPNDMSHSGYLPETNQRCIQICMKKNNPYSYTMVLNCMKEILPFIKPNKDGYKLFEIFPCYHWLQINEEKKEYNIAEKGTFGFKPYFSFNTLEEVLSKIQENYTQDSYSDND